ncbi:MAG: PHP domain-containing protein [Desulfovibrionales bacterium]
MTVDWCNPYQNRNGRWLRGNLHAHASPFSPCASVAVPDLCAAYLRCAQDFLSISEHMKVTAPHWEGLTLIPGVEWNSRSPYMANRSLAYQHHIGVYALETAVLDTAVACSTPEQMCAATTGADSLLIANHPNWLIPEHYDQYTLHRLSRDLDGLEIYNALLEWDEGEADATNRWDRLLTLGALLLGFAGDDSHTAGEAGRAWISARVDGQTPGAVFQSLKRGNFYCSTGVELDDIGRKGDGIFVSLNCEARIRVIGSGGKLLAEHVGNGFSFSFNGSNTDYARFHITDRNWAQAWSQPFFQYTPQGRP